MGEEKAYIEGKQHDEEMSNVVGGIMDPKEYGGKNMAELLEGSGRAANEAICKMATVTAEFVGNQSFNTPKDTE